jgi:hypothetical protein
MRVSVCLRVTWSAPVCVSVRVCVFVFQSHRQASRMFVCVCVCVCGGGGGGGVYKHVFFSPTRVGGRPLDPPPSGL